MLIIVHSVKRNSLTLHLLSIDKYVKKVVKKWILGICLYGYERSS